MQQRLTNISTCPSDLIRPGKQHKQELKQRCGRRSLQGTHSIDTRPWAEIKVARRQRSKQLFPTATTGKCGRPAPRCVDAKGAQSIGRGALHDAHGTARNEAASLRKEEEEEDIMAAHTRRPTHVTQAETGHVEMVD
ncbi:hypothetical protein HPB50_003035 [Hyalomma asiaticum]|uniref:Uncharacterized protein n=1 Tax=Hyalomma asiaticum TaxID=266040 RepID=A0ACB7SAI9_HYAAI|nr:hypothetical protein HPB50_003035 [Hyalomma asiaticum]